MKLMGHPLVARPRRLALMNLYLHQVEPHIKLGDSIYEVPTSERLCKGTSKEACKNRNPNMRFTWNGGDNGSRWKKAC